MKTLLTFLTISVPAFMFGQVTLDSAAVIPAIGEKVDYYIMNNPGSFGGPGASGTKKIWDFSKITKGDSTDLEFEGPRGGLQRDPANTTLCEQYSGFTGIRIQYKSTSSDFYIMGTRAGITQISYENDSLLKFKFPVAYNDSYTSNYHFETGGISNTKRKGAYKVTVDASGSIILPFGGLNDILRVKIEENYNDTTGRLRPRTSVYSSTTYEYWQKGTGSYVMSVKYEDDDGTLDTIVTYRKQDQVIVSPVDTTEEEDTTSIVEAEPLKRLQLFPNPASNQITVQGFGIEKDAKVHIVSLSGTIHHVVEFDTGNFDISDYPNGVYFLMVEGDNYEPVRFIKQN